MFPHTQYCITKAAMLMESDEALEGADKLLAEMELEEEARPSDLRNIALTFLFVYRSVSKHNTTHR